MSTSKPTVELNAGALRLALRPDLGGSIAGLWHGGLPVLRSTEPAALAGSRQSGSYPLAPYSNRIGFHHFNWQGHDYTTQRNFDDNPHSVHGVAWQRPWQVVAAGADEAELLLVHAPDADWPFAFELRQRFALTPTELSVSFHFTNTAPLAQPVGLGWHPYFPKRARSHIQIDLTGRWDSDATELPVQLVAQSGIAADVAALDFDNCFEGWRGAASIRDEAFSLQLTSSLPYLVVFTPGDRDYYCVEPVSHVSNAIQFPDPAVHGLRTLEPGERFEAWMKLEIAPA